MAHTSGRRSAASTLLDFQSTVRRYPLLQKDLQSSFITRPVIAQQILTQSSITDFGMQWSGRVGSYHGDRKIVLNGDRINVTAQLASDAIE